MAAMSNLNKSILAFSAISMGFSLISVSFSFYYVKIFLNFYHIEESWFHVSQSLFLVWNAINDPLFAYLQDTTYFKFSRTRRESILYAGPFFALSFIIPWFPWGTAGTSPSWIVGLHLIVALCLWDTMFTYVGLAHCCLCTEISQDNNVRLKLIRYGKIGGLIGTLSPSILEYFSGNLNNFFAFQMTTIVIAFCSFLLFRFGGQNAHTQYDIQNMAECKSSNISSDMKEKGSMVRLTLQILCNRDFLAFVVTNFLQEFHRSFLHSFMAIVCDQLIQPDQVSTSIKSTFYGLVPFMSSILIIVCTPMIGRIGYFKVIHASFIWKICAGTCLYLSGSRNPWLLMMFFLLDNCFANSAFGLFNLPLSDIADKDKVRYHRKHPLSSMVFGTNALVVKPALSLSPMLIVAILNHYGYEDLKKKTLSSVGIEQLNDAMFYLTCFYPVVLGIIQFIAWSFYTIRDSNVKEDLNVSIEVDG